MPGITPTQNTPLTRNETSLVRAHLSAYRELVAYDLQTELGRNHPDKQLTRDLTERLAELDHLRERLAALISLTNKQEKKEELYQQSPSKRR